MMVGSVIGRMLHFPPRVESAAQMHSQRAAGLLKLLAKSPNSEHHHCAAWFWTSPSPTAANSQVTVAERLNQARQQTNQHNKALEAHNPPAKTEFIFAAICVARLGFSKVMQNGAQDYV
jgi:hypothetical protein